ADLVPLVNANEGEEDRRCMGPGFVNPPVDLALLRTKLERGRESVVLVVRNLDVRVRRQVEVAVRHRRQFDHGPFSRENKRWPRLGHRSSANSSGSTASGMAASRQDSTSSSSIIASKNGRKSVLPVRRSVFAYSR